jgi:PAP2 superfamily
MENLDIIRAVRFNGAFDAIWLPITHLGSEFAYVVMLTIIYLLAPKLGRQLGFWFGVTFVTNTVLKLLFNLPRPYDLDPSLTSQAATETARTPGLPSGHAQNSATTWGFLALKLRRTWFTVLAVVVVLLISFSRMSLGVHFLEDVLAGLAIGGVIAFVASRITVPVLTPLVGTALIVAGFIASALLVKEPYGQSLAVVIGFAVTTAAFKPPASTLGKTLFVLGGLVVAVGLYLLSSRYLPDEFKRTGWGSFVRYTALLLIMGEIYPRAILRQRAG